MPDNGAAFDRPESLSKAEMEILVRLQSDPGRPDLLALKGRAELIEGQSERAIEDLIWASEQGPSTAVLADLGAAYALRGDADQRNGDYGHALDLLLRALRLDPKNRTALFNLAIVYERIRMLDEAVATWKRLLKIESNGPWADEARLRLSQAEKERLARKTALGRIPEDPRAFLAMQLNGDTTFEAEYLQNAFWSRWLPNAGRDKAADDAAKALAEEWVKRFGDRSLRDAYQQAAKGDVATLLDAAGAVITDNIHGHNDEVLARAGELVNQLRAHGQDVAAIRIEIERAYSYRRSTRHEPCLAITDQLLAKLDGTTYPWLTGRTHLEHSVCVGRAGALGSAKHEREETARISRQRGLTGMALQAEELVTSIDALSGNAAAVWEMAPRGLATYWTTAAEEARAQQGLYDMALAARAMGWKEAAIATQAAAVDACTRLKNLQLEALNRVYLASLLREADREQEAVTELDRADMLFRQLPQGATVANLMLSGQVRKAEAEAAGPTPAKAIGELDALSRLPNFSSLEARMRAQQARGIALASSGAWQSAKVSFEQATLLASDHVRSFAEPLSRIAAAEMAMDSRRNLVQIELQHKGDVAAALLTWEGRWDDLTPRAPARLASAANSEMALIFVVLPAGATVFLSNGEHVKGRLLTVPPALLEAEIREFHRLCASPDSDAPVLRASGRKLYAQLIQPYAAELKGARRILIEPDKWFSSLPFMALVDETGQYLSQRHPVGIISSLAHADERGDVFSASTRAVIVSAPAAGGNSNLPFLASAARESTELASRMTQTLLLEGSTGAPQTIAGRMASAELVHFAGHGWSNGGNAALVLGPSQEGGSRYLAATDLAALNWKECRLAVLSACLTAEGEERGPVNPQSLVRALLAAGARRVVAARWSIDEESTAMLMRLFYQALFSGATPVTALQEASAGIRATPGWQHPYYWAAFDIFGAL